MSHAEAYVNQAVPVVTKKDVEGGEVITRELAASADAYMVRLLQLGAVEGALGEMTINPLLKPVLEALHQVLAGGEVEIRVTQAGHQQLVRELNGRLDRATEEVNALNRRAGKPVLPRT
jgi:hypothetical protein